MSFDKNELASLTRLFSAGVLQELSQQGRSPKFARLIQGSSILRRGTMPALVGDAFDRAFNVLRASGNRDEYVYRSAITQKLLLGRHSLRTASIINEMRAGGSKADVVVLNGTSTAYEIKSERDSLTRLPSQLASYRKVFATVNVVTGGRHAADILPTLPSDVGLLVLSDMFTLRVVKAAETRPERTSPVEILHSLRTGEAVAILEALGVEVPIVPNTQLRSMLSTRFAGLDPTATHAQMVKVLKETRSQSAIAGYLRSLPFSLRAAMLASSMNEAGRNRVREALATPLDAALVWS